MQVKTVIFIVNQLKSDRWLCNRRIKDTILQQKEIWRPFQEKEMEIPCILKVPKKEIIKLLIFKFFKIWCTFQKPHIQRNNQNPRKVSLNLPQKLLQWRIISWITARYRHAQRGKIHIFKIFHSKFQLKKRKKINHLLLDCSMIWILNKLKSDRDKITKKILIIIQFIKLIIHSHCN